MPARTDPSALAVTGIGIVSSVGRDAATACASVRAGLERPGPAAGAVMLEPDTHEVVEVVGHPVRPLTDGFESVARWLQIAPAAVADLSQSARLPPPQDAAFWRSTRVVAVLPPPGGDRWAHDPLCSAEALRGSFLTPLFHMLGLTLPDPRDRVAVAGRVGLFQTLAGAGGILAASRAERLLILAVDSLLDGASLAWLGESGRLRGPDAPDGLAPGEAAVALLIERPDAARARGATPLAGLGATVAVPTQVVPPVMDEDEPGVDFVAAGRVLGDALRVCLTDLASPPAASVSLSADLNGEMWKAKAYGVAFSRLPLGARPGLSWMLNATSVGDLGAATSAFDVALAARALQRGYAPSTATLVSACDDDGAAGACLLTSLP